jgi:hypothetical protein
MEDNNPPTFRCWRLVPRAATLDLVVAALLLERLAVSLGLVVNSFDGGGGHGGVALNGMDVSRAKYSL